MCKTMQESGAKMIKKKDVIILLFSVPVFLLFCAWIGYGSNNGCPCRSGAKNCSKPYKLAWSVPEGMFKRYKKTYPINGTSISVDISGEFDFENNFNNFCKNSGNLRAVLPIYSRVDGFHKRNVIRETLGVWAKKLNCKIFFVVGVSVNITVHRLLQKEHAKEKDVLVYGKIDTYRDLNDKAVAMLEWLDTYCLHVPYVIHLIDDTYVNLKLFLDKLDAIKIKDYVLGGVTYIPTIRVSPDFSTVVSEQEYPYPMFPVYAIGFAYAFPSHVSRLLLNSIYTAPYCWIEDIWIVGHVREDANIPIVPLGQTNWTARGLNKKPVEVMRQIAVVHSCGDKLLRQMYAPFIE